MSPISSDAAQEAQIAQDRAQHGDLVAWLEGMPELAEPRGTPLYPTPDTLSPVARTLYEKPVRPE